MISKPFIPLLLGTALCASSAPISWGPATDVNTDTDVSLNGGLLEAVNGADDGFTDSLTINGVTFVSNFNLLGLSSNVDSFTNPAAPNNLNISGVYESLLSTVDFGDETSISLPNSGSLTQGESYEIQVWFADTRNPTRVMRYADDVNTSPGEVDLDGGDVQYAIGTFVADGPTQTLGLLATNFGRAHITAYQLRALSEDSPPTPPGIINWGDATNATGDADISTDGDLVIAFNATGNGVTSNPTVNGVEFTSTGAFFNSSSTVDVFNINSVPNNSISGAYDELLSSVDFGNGSSPTIQLAGSGLLIPGEEYQLQVWFSDTRNTRSMRFADLQGNSVTLGGGAAQYSIGTFTASGANQGLQIFPQGTNNAHINAYQIRALSIGDRLLGSFPQATEAGIDTFEVTLNFSQEVTGLTESDLIITEGGLVSGSLSGNGTIFRFLVTSTNAEGFTVSLLENSVASAAGDENAVNESASRTFTPADIAPGPTVTLFQSLETVSDPYVVTVHFNEAISGLSLDDFEVTNGTLSGFVDHTLFSDFNIANYSLTVTPTNEGTVTLTLPALSVTSNSIGAGNSESNVLMTEYELNPLAEINGSNTSSSREFEVFISFTPHVNGFESSDIVVTNGSVISFEMQGRREFADRFYKATIQAQTPGDVTVFVPEGSAANRNFPTMFNSRSNVFTTNITSDFADEWVIDAAVEWNEGTSSGLTLSDGFAEPSGSTIGTYSSVIYRFDRPQLADKLTLTQTPVWGADRWEEAGNISPPGAGSGAPIFLPIANDDYFFFAQSGSSYHAWHSTNMSTWTRLDQFSGDGFDRATSAEYKDDTFYLLVDTPNDHTPSMFTDTRESLSDGQPGTNHGIVIPYSNVAQGNATEDLLLSSPGGDSALFLDNADNLFHVFSENHAPIDAPNHSFDSPLANHVTSADGLTGFIPQEHLPPIDLRSTPTDPPQFGFYNHPHVSGSPISNPRPYHIHIGEQEALGDWSLMKIGERYYAFGDYEREVEGGGTLINSGILYGDSLYDSFEIVGSVGEGHPDPTTGFAEGQFYLITQRNIDFISSGPWVDGVEARAGVDTNGDDIIDVWTDWQSVSESYDHTEGFSRVITLTPAAIDMSALPAGFGFQFELRLDDSVVAGSTPIMDRVEMSFNPSNFQVLSNTLGIPVDETGDFNTNGIPNLIEFATGQDFIPQLQEDGTLILPTTSEALADGYRLELQYSTNLIDWDTATETSDLVSILTITNDSDSGDLETIFLVDSTEETQLFWRVVAF